MMDPALHALAGPLVGTRVVLVPTSDADRERVHALRRAGYTELATRQLGQWDDAHEHARFVARWNPATSFLLHREGDIGALELDLHDDALFVRSIVLVPGAHGHGIGTAVLLAVRGAARRSDRAVTLSVTHANARAAALYRRLGFVVERADEQRTWMRWSLNG